MGPILGALLAVLFYRLIKMLEYETANPGQDFNAHEADAFSFDEENAATAMDVMPPTIEDMRMKSNFSGSDQMSGDGGRMDMSIGEMIAGRSQRSNSLNRTLSAGQDYVGDHPNVVSTTSHGAAMEAYHNGPMAEKGELPPHRDVTPPGDFPPRGGLTPLREFPIHGEATPDGELPPHGDLGGDYVASGLRKAS